MPETKIVAIIPARMSSSRLPGKPLLEFYGLPMVEHVRRRALLSGAFDDVAVATCDVEISQAVERFGGKVLMTSPKHETATDRVVEAAERTDATHVINLQGDEILVVPEDLARMADAIENSPEVPAWNAIARVERREEVSDHSIVKCVVSVSKRILFCSRDFSSLPLRNSDFGPIRKILGIAAFELSFLKRLSEFPRTPLEAIQSVDQLRVLEADQTLQGIEFGKGYPGINEWRDADVVRTYFEKDSLQSQILHRVLSLQNEQQPAVRGGHESET